MGSGRRRIQIMKSHPRSSQLVKAKGPVSHMMKIPRGIAVGAFALICSFLAAVFILPPGSPEPQREQVGYTRVEMAAAISRTAVVVMTSRGSGSGTLFSRLDADGQPAHLVWTAAHVVAIHRSVTTIIDHTGKITQVVKFAPVKVVIPIVRNGKHMGDGTLVADIIQYSNAKTGDDLAILKIRDPEFPGIQPRFWLSRGILPVGSEVYTVGSPFGLQCANTFSVGYISQHGREYNGKVLDQVSSIVYGGASGSGVFTTDGQYIGMVTMMTAPQIGYMVPVRRMHEWATRAKVVWALNPLVSMPGAEALKSLPVENDNTSVPMPLPVQPRCGGPPPGADDDD